MAFLCKEEDVIKLQKSKTESRFSEYFMNETSSVYEQQKLPALSGNRERNGFR